MTAPQSSFKCPYGEIEAHTRQDTLHWRLRSTWRYPVSCNRDRLRYSLCSVCMNQTDHHYPYEYTPRQSSTNGWAEPYRHGRATDNIKSSPNQAREENHKKEGAVLCFGKATSL